MSMFHTPDVIPSADQWPFAFVFAVMGIVFPDGSEIVSVAPATGLPVALSVTFPCNRPVPRTCAFAANATSRSMTADVVAISLRMKISLSSLRTRRRSVIFPQKTRRGGPPAGREKLRDDELEVEPGAETEDSRRLH